MTLYLTPVDLVHSQVSLAKPCDWDAIRYSLGKDTLFAELQEKAHDGESLYCWAARGRNRSIFEGMQAGDDVFFSLPGSGQFNYFGVIAHKVVSPSFALKYWRDVKLLDWQYIYFLRDVREISIDKPSMRKVLGYDKNDRFQCLRRVLPNRLGGISSAIVLFETIERHLAANGLEVKNL